LTSAFSVEGISAVTTTATRTIKSSTTTTTTTTTNITNTCFKLNAINVSQTTVPKICRVFQQMVIG